MHMSVLIKLMKTNYFAYATVILTIAIVYIFGELKYEKKMSKTRDLWLLEDTSELEEEIERLQTAVQVLAKQNKEYEIMFSVIKLKIEQNKQDKDDKVKPSQQSTIPKLDHNYPGKFIPKGQPSPNDNILSI